MDIQTLHQVACDDVRRADNDIIHYVAGEGHEAAFLGGLQGEPTASIVLYHIIVLDTYVEEVALGFGLLQPVDQPRVQNITGRVEVDDFVGGGGAASIAETGEAEGGLQELLFWRFDVLLVSLGFFLK
jgi:hypothetical protein